MFTIGDKIRVNLHQLRIDNAVVKAVIESTSGKQLQVDFGHRTFKPAQVRSVDAGAALNG